MSLRLRLTLLYSTLMGVILLIISASVTIVVTQLLLKQVDETLESSYDVVIKKLQMMELGRVTANLKPTDLSSNVYMQIWGLNGMLQDNYPVLNNFESVPFDQAGLHEDSPAYRDFSGKDWHIRVLNVPLEQNGRRLATLQLASKLNTVDKAR